MPQVRRLFNLGVAMPEVAFVPPFMPGIDVEEDRATRQVLTAIGGASAGRWREAGYLSVVGQCRRGAARRQ